MLVYAHVSDLVEVYKAHTASQSSLGRCEMRTAAIAVLLQSSSAL
jgi:hypothetical protein